MASERPRRRSWKPPALSEQLPHMVHSAGVQAPGPARQDLKWRGDTVVSGGAWPRKPRRPGWGAAWRGCPRAPGDMASVLKEGAGFFQTRAPERAPPRPSMLQGTGDPAADAGGCWPEWAELGVLPSAPRPPGTGRLALGTPPTRSVLRCRAQMLSLRKLVKGAVQEKR